MDHYLFEIDVNVIEKMKLFFYNFFLSHDLLSTTLKIIVKLVTNEQLWYCFLVNFVKTQRDTFYSIFYFYDVNLIFLMFVSLTPPPSPYCRSLFAFITLGHSLRGLPVGTSSNGSDWTFCR
jgi:hypothetical protein